MSTGNERALGMLKTALEMEEEGGRFYEKAVAESENPLARDILQMLREDELVHVERIKQIYAALSGGGAWNEDWRQAPAPRRDLSQIFHDLATRQPPDTHPSAADIEALEVGLDFEAKSVSFYKKHLAQAEDPLEIAFLQALVAEEEAHFRVLDDLELYLTDPDSWFFQKEKGGLDGA